MYLKCLLFSIVCVFTVLAIETEAAKSKVPINPSLYPLLVRYTNYSSAAYIRPCPRPPYGAVVVGYVNVTSTDTQATLFRSDNDSELILAFPGTVSNKDEQTDFQFRLVPYEVVGVTGCKGCRAHRGFLTAWKSVIGPVRKLLNAEKKKHPTYKLTITGHSLGAALAALAYSSLKGLDYNVQAAYTFGQPRIGNQQLADYVDKISGATTKKAGVFHRVTHTFDGVPQLPPKALNYRHSRTEYWELDTKSGSQSAKRTFRCFGQEPSDCNASQSRGFINSAHTRYSGINMGEGASCGL